MYMIETEYGICPLCKRKGYIECPECEGTGIYEDWDGQEKICWLCDGEEIKKCSICNGKGKAYIMKGGERYA